MFEINKDYNDIKSKAISIRLPIEQINAINDLVDKSGVNRNQIIVQMVGYCLTHMKRKRPLGRSGNCGKPKT